MCEPGVPFDRSSQLIDENSQKLPYRRRKKEERTSVHHGQRKLLLSEIQFLTLFWNPKTVPKPVIVYAGAAPGTHIPFLGEMFPQFTFHLYDPSRFSITTSAKIIVHNEYFTDEIAHEWGGRNDVFFISDIRRGFDIDDETVNPNMTQEQVSVLEKEKSERMEATETSILGDMIMQENWTIIMNPVHALLKFRLPWANPGQPEFSEYLQGHVFIQVCSPQNTTETRLVPTKDKFGSYTRNNWNNKDYEEKMFYHNTVSREITEYTNPYTDCADDVDSPELLHDYDSIGEVQILIDYFFKMGGSDATSFENGIAFSKIISENLGLKLSKLRTGKKTTRIVTKNIDFERRTVQIAATFDKADLGKVPKREGPVKMNIPLPRDTIRALTNPQIVVKSYTYETKTFNVVSDNYLVGGTKQRILGAYLENVRKPKIIYAGPPSGYASVALAYCASMWGKKAILFSSTHITKGTAAEYAVDLGLEIRTSKTLKDAKKDADIFENRNKDCFQVPFGMFNDELKQYLVAAISESWTGPIPKRIWLAAGSGLILAALQKLWPETKFMVVQVGKKIYEDQLERSQLFVATENFWDDTKDLPPWDSLESYDAKIWKFMKQHGEDGDYVWNVAGSVKTDAKEISEALLHLRDQETSLIEKAKKLFLTKKQFPYRKNYLPDRKIMMDNLLAFKPEKGKVIDSVVVRTFPDDYEKADGISNWYTEEERIKCNFKGKKSPYDMWNDSGSAESLAENAVFEDHNAASSVEKYPKAWREALYSVVKKECNIFNPTIMMQFLHSIGDPKEMIVLDPSSGWGDRLLAAAACEVMKYTGYDPNAGLEKKYLQVIEDFVPEDKRDYYNCLPIPFEEGDDEPEEYDVVFTSPPFYDTEHYISENQSIYKGKNLRTYQEWIDEWYFSYLQKAWGMLRKDGHMALYIEDLPKGFVDDTKKIMEKLGAKLLGSSYFKQDYMVYGVATEGINRPLWIWKKN